MYKYLNVNDSNNIREITLNRPEVHNAFNEQFIEEITQAVSSIDSQRLLLIRSAGNSFCAGADLEWMKKMKGYSLEENFSDSLALAKMFQAIDDVKVPVIAQVKGYTLGGGTGILACCDYILADAKSKFGFTEVKLGLIPAAISPFLIRKIGENYARAYFLSGQRFGVETAKHIGLIHEFCEGEKLEERTSELVESFIQTAPQAVRECKKLIFDVVGAIKSKGTAELNELTSQRIAKRRISDEAQKGMSALLNKEKIDWK